MRTIFRTTFRGARGLTLGLLLSLAIAGAAYAVTSSPSPDFAMTPSVASATTAPGGTVGYGINIQASGSFSDNVTLAVSSTLPAGTTATFGTNPVFVDSALASATTLWVTTSASTPTNQPISITVNGTNSSGSISHAVTVTLTVTPSGSPDFSTEVTPSTQYVGAGNSVSYTVQTTALNGFTGNVVLSAKTVPGSVPLAWNSQAPTTAQSPSVSVPVGQPATLRIPTSVNNPPGSYAVTITASNSAGTITHVAAATLNIDLFSASGDVVSNLYPGAPAQSLPVTLRNPYNSPVTVTGLAASVAADQYGNVIDPVANAPVVGCLASWFKFTPSNVSSTNTVQLPPLGQATISPSTTATVSDPTIQMSDPNQNQDKCKGIHLQVNYVGTGNRG
jgi:hypothetical protein